MRGCQDCSGKSFFCKKVFPFKNIMLNNATCNFNIFAFLISAILTQKRPSIFASAINAWFFVFIPLLILCIHFFSIKIHKSFNVVCVSIKQHYIYIYIYNVAWWVYKYCMKYIVHEMYCKDCMACMRNPNESTKPTIKSIEPNLMTKYVCKREMNTNRNMK